MNTLIQTRIQKVSGLKSEFDSAKRELESAIILYFFEKYPTLNEIRLELGFNCEYDGMLFDVYLDSVTMDIPLMTKDSNEFYKLFLEYYDIKSYDSGDTTSIVITRSGDSFEIEDN